MSLRARLLIDFMSKEVSIPEKIISSKIFLIRAQKVMLDSDLADLYGVETKVLKQQVRRNIESFPDDFMFELNKEEFVSLRSQFVTSNRGGTRYLPMVFTEHGVLMLSSVLKSKRARQVNIRIMRVYSKLRKMLLTHKDLLLKMNELESKVTNHDKSIKQVFDYLNRFIKENTTPQKAIGFKQKKL